ncbi:TetR/AcrR family transcriptional regulator [Nocardia blacklockiae]|uniref:TetR/AcrR family transcriptional regulator n=1 Tax=Nocardia blacklockiae TaxID=480036 RepID=UPI001E592672|nr:TetR/AcrR family transcriptional regulator [Nocardia blacklockiae]
MSQETNAGRMYAGQPVEDRQRQRRARFLESGLTVFARDGYANSSVGAICKDAGLSSRQFYEEFTGRESLLLELYEQIDEQSREAVAAALAAQTDRSAVEVIDAAVRAYVESIGRDPRKARVALVEVVGAGPTVEKFRLELRRAWGSLLASAAEDAALQGEIPPGDYEMRVLAIIGAVNYVVDAWSGAEPRPPLDDVIRVLRRVIIGAVSA